MPAATQERQAIVIGISSAVSGVVGGCSEGIFNECPRVKKRIQTGCEWVAVPRGWMRFSDLVGGGIGRDVPSVGISIAGRVRLCRRRAPQGRNRVGSFRL